MPAAERRQPHLAAAAGDLHGTSVATINSAFANAPFLIDDYIAPDDTTCPAPGRRSLPNGVLNGTGLPGGCTRDLVHRFYNEQYQINGGQQDRYVTGSDAVGLTMGHYDTTAAAHLPVPALAPARRTTPSPTTSSRRRSAARSSTTSGSSPQPRRPGPVRSPTAAPTTCTRSSARTASRPAHRCTRPRRARRTRPDPGGQPGRFLRAAGGRGRPHPPARCAATTP